MRRILEIGGEETPIWLASQGESHILHIGERALPCMLTAAGGRGAYLLDLGGARVPLRIALGEETTYVHLNGRSYTVGRVDPSQTLGAAGAGSRGDRLVAPMPGVVISIGVAPGDAVAEGQGLLVIESMKLETTLTAPRDGVVAEAPFAAGDTFGLKDVLLTLVPLEAA